MRKSNKEFIKSPLNWVGNKYKYLENINNLIGNSKFINVYDVFMGSGNILLNLDCDISNYIGNDNIPLVPLLYKTIKLIGEDFIRDELEDIVSEWNRFSCKKDYYDFRDYWNHKYLNYIYNKKFIIETVLLLKMCSNSMVRFNASKGYFNQGFRGLTKGKDEFFTESMKLSIINQLNLLRNTLSDKPFSFKVDDFKTILEGVGKGDLVILDPPYILRTDMYDTNFTKDDDDFILDFLQYTEASYIYFNYLERDNVLNDRLLKFINSTHPRFVEELNTKSLSGQGRVGTKSVVEAMISNIGRD